MLSPHPSTKWSPVTLVGRPAASVPWSPVRSCGPTQLAAAKSGAVTAAAASTRSVRTLRWVRIQRGASDRPLVGGCPLGTRPPRTRFRSVDAVLLDEVEDRLGQLGTAHDEVG